jgi:hypothetical protein
VSADECLYSWLPTVSCTMERSFIWLILPLWHSLILSNASSR